MSESEDDDIFMNDAWFDRFRKVHPDDVPDDYVEYKGLLYLTAAYLLSYGCTIFHSVSFVWKEKAWLLAGKSGVGKTTQYLNWKKLFPKEIRMISGDMPILDFRKGRIMVCPSPWNGKENFKGASPCELGGIVFLKQGKENVFHEADQCESILTLFHQFCPIPENKEEIRILALMVERIEKEVPLWTFVNDGTQESLKVLRSAILDYLETEEP
ncbi:MAG: hypothetical protein IJI66_14375 [Erysipelotrichaceae bacterium]|nr:hypothetical protein [Clostridia bacterium]MBQ6217779.1 hypothetical protein [Erysipelotrichaceae bacterium]MBR0420344.1 hypothetical protein [Erysipelotrichaceae bacterium]